MGEERLKHKEKHKRLYNGLVNIFKEYNQNGGRMTDNIADLINWAYDQKYKPDHNPKSNVAQ